MLSGGYATGTLDTVIHATVDKSRRKLIMAAVKSNAYFSWSFANERIELEDGGANITNPIAIGRNPNVGTYQYYNPIPVNQTNEFTTLRYGYSRFAGSVIVSDQEEDEITGEAALFKILREKMRVLETSINERFSGYAYGIGSGTDPNGLGAAVPDDPTTGTFGGVSRATEAQWRSSAFQFSGGLDSTNIEEALDDVLLDLTVNGERPDIFLFGRNLYRIYRQAVRDKFVIDLAASGAGKKLFDLGFRGCEHAGIPIMYDENCGVNRAYALNSKYLRWHILRHVNFKTKKLIAPWTIDANGSRTVWQGNLCAWKMHRTHGVIRNGTTG